MNDKPKAEEITNYAPNISSAGFPMKNKSLGKIASFEPATTKQNFKLNYPAHLNALEMARENNGV